MKRVLFVAFLLFFIIFLSGCIQNILGQIPCDQNNKYGDSLFCVNSKDFLLSKIMDSTTGKTGKCQKGECRCFVCERSNPPWPFNLLYSDKIEDCHIEEKCDMQKVGEILKSNNELVLPFMLGSGPDFIGFAEASAYCQGSMRMAVKWIMNTRDNLYGYKYSEKEPEHVNCLHEKNAIPVYLLYKGYWNSLFGGILDPYLTEEDVKSAEEFAKMFKDKGMVIISAEVNFNSEDPEIVAKVAEQIERMSNACPNCYIALVPKSMDFEGMQKVLDKLQGVSRNPDGSVIVPPTGLGGLGKKLPENMILGFPIDSREIPCMKASDFYLTMYQKMMDFHQRYDGIPMFIPYIILDRGAKGKDGCEWKEGFDTEYIQGFFEYFLPLFVHKLGGIGAAIYSTSGKGPLTCNDCALIEKASGVLGMMGGIHHTDASKIWFWNCQHYYKPTSQTKTMTGAMPIIYGTKDGDQCFFAFNHRFYYTRIRSIDLSKDPEPINKRNVGFLVCEDCFSKRIDFYNAGIGKDLPITRMSISRNTCNKYIDLFRRYAQLYDIDVNVIRAVAMIESGMDECAMSVVDKTSRCNPLNIDKDDNRIISLVSSIDIGPQNRLSCENPGCYNMDKVGENQKPCAYGIMQTIEYPETVWFDNQGELIPHVDRNWGEISGYTRGERNTYSYGTALFCAIYPYLEDISKGDVNIREDQCLLFDPYKPAHSICLGAYKLAMYYRAYQDYLSNKGESWFGGWYTTDQEEWKYKKNFLAYLMAVYRYAGYHPEDWLNEWHRYKDTEPETVCGTNPDYWPCKDDPVEENGIEIRGEVNRGKVSLTYGGGYSLGITTKIKCVGQKDPVTYIIACGKKGEGNSKRGMDFLTYWIAFSEGCKDGLSGCPPETVNADAESWYSNLVSGG